ncbi:DEKNAAC102410 [Brettanomyces naardenensis]|uniref:DEKNAAC102410 n=1 Tax=Brettanomyces naardenensis TaxID=13370 RepID=A0A448YKG9_BRENA|nr:DEKNAAC102410 [Brettanomyces naardenensis]
MTVDWDKYLSDEAKLRLPSVMKMAARTRGTISFASGLPHSDCFPMKGLSIKYETPESNFKKCAIGSNEDLANKLEADDEIYEACQYMSGRGTTFFDKWCHSYIEKLHKPAYEEWDTLIQAGGTFSLSAILRLLCNPGEDTILAEELTYPCFLETCKPLRVKVFPVKMDEDGVIPEDMDRVLTNWNTDKKTRDFKKPKFFYSMPVGQNPSGVTMNASRKQGLLDVCRKHDIIIVEDDPYYHLQLNMETEEIQSLLKFDRDGRVIRIDSFSKMLMPGMRISIVTANKTFTQKLTMSNELSIHSAAAPSQFIVYMLMQEWKAAGFRQWLDHIQDLYRKRRDVLLDAFEKHLPADLCTWNRPSYGMFIWIKINMDRFPKLDADKSDVEWAAKVEDVIFEQALDEEIQLSKGHWFMIDNLNMAGFRATYACASFDDLYHGTERFGKAIRQVHAKLYD